MNAFNFNTKLDQTLLLGVRANTVAELLAGVKSTPDSSIYFHTHRFLNQHQYLSPEPPNDFAYWVSNILGDDVLGARFGIDRSRPVVTQISRFDYLKDPLGVIRAYKLAKANVDIQLVLAGGGATDDPEGPMIMEQVKAEADKDPDIFVLFLPPASDIEINALQRGSTVVLQKSLKGGFESDRQRSTVKGKPTIAGAVGGIPLQIAHKYSGILTRPIEGTAQWIKQLVSAPEYARRLGLNGKEHVRNNFLITRHLKDYLLLFVSLFHEGDIVSL